MPLVRLLRSIALRAAALADLAEIQKEVFGDDDGATPNVYADPERVRVLAAKMQAAITILTIR